MEMPGDKANIHREYECLCGSDTAVVFVHGILGSPFRFRRLAGELARRGADCYALLLPGHGGTAKEFRHAQNGSREAYVKRRAAEIAKTHRRLFVAGYSLGGLIGLDCALDGLTEGVILLNTPIRVRLNLRAVTRSMKTMARPVGAKDETLRTYRERNSISGARVLEYPLWLGQYLYMYQYLRRVRKKLCEVRVPVLIAQAAGDESVDRDGAHRLKAGLVNAKVIILDLMESLHGDFPEQDEIRLLDAILRFIKEE